MAAKNGHRRRHRFGDEDDCREVDLLTRACSAIAETAALTAAVVAAPTPAARRDSKEDVPTPPPTQVGTAKRAFPDEEIH